MELSTKAFSVGLPDEVQPPTPTTASSSELHGQNLFSSIGCALCHSPTLVTNPSIFTGQSGVTYHPHSDFALHHMGQKPGRLRQPRALKELGHALEVVRVPVQAYDRLFPGAPEVRETFQYFEEQTYFGPQGEGQITAANALVPGGFTTFADWARTRMNRSADAPAPALSTGMGAGASPTAS